MDELPKKIKPVVYNNINELVNYYFEPVGGVPGGNINWTIMCSLRMSQIFNIALGSSNLMPKNRQRILEWFKLMRIKNKDVEDIS